MSQSQGFVDSSKPQYVCRLKKALYGRKQTPRAWYDKLKRVLLDKGFVNIVFDSSLFVLGTSHVTIFVLIYVDDILLTGSDCAYIQSLIEDLNSQFSLKDLGELNFFLGIEVHKSEHGLYLCQAKYAIELLVKTHMVDAEACQTPMTTSVKLCVGDSEPFSNPTLYRNTIETL